MGVFHCPFGAAFQDDDGCVDCGLCYAKTKAEIVAASRRVREHITSQTENNKPTRKIAIAGKGGVGKSTVVTLMANALKEEGYTVLVVDTDESNPGLYRLFGFAKPPQPFAGEFDRPPGQTATPGYSWPKDPTPFRKSRRPLFVKMAT